MALSNRSTLGLFLLISILLVPAIGFSQRIKPKKDSLSAIKLVCPLTDAKQMAEQKQTLDYGTTELKLILTSATDTIVKACADGVVSTIVREETGTWEVVFYHDDYWFWISGITKPTVTKNQRIKAGQSIGTLTPQSPIEILLFDFETPVDPKTYLRCFKE